jgi:HEAT repeat protein
VAAENALSRAAPTGAAGVPALVEALKSQKPRVRIMAAWALANIGAASSPAAANLSAVLRATNKNTDPHDEWPQLLRLARAIGKAEGGLLDALLEVLVSPRVLAESASLDAQTRGNLWVTVAAIVTQSGAKIPDAKRRAIGARVVKTLEFALQGERPNDLLFIGAARAAGALGAEAKDAVPILMKIFQPDKRGFMKVAERDGMIFHGYVATTSVQLEAMRTLGRIGISATPALPLLRIIAEGKEDKTVWQGALPNFSDVARDAIRQIETAL